MVWMQQALFNRKQYSIIKAPRRRYCPECNDAQTVLKLSNLALYGSDGVENPLRKISGNAKSCWGGVRQV